LRLLVSKSNIQ